VHTGYRCFAPAKVIQEGAAMEDLIWGWDEIGKYLELHPRTAQNFEHTLNLKVHRLGDGPKARVFALKSELRAWLVGFRAERGVSPKSSPGEETSTGTVAEPILKRIIKIGQDATLYRRDYYMRFELAPSTGGVYAKIKYSFELCNASDQKQLFVQEVTIDHSERGQIEAMSLTVNGKVAYNVCRPAPAEEFIGYAAYQGPRQLIAPSASGAKYLCRASWTIHRKESDLWYNHMLLPTVGVKIETLASPDFEITPTFLIRGLVLKGEHLDIAWRKRRPAPPNRRLARRS
jgi:hypothetical protein